MSRLDDTVLKFVEDLPHKVTYPNITDPIISHSWYKGRTLGIRIIGNHLRHNLGVSLPTFKSRNLTFRTKAEEKAFLEGYNAVKRYAEAFIDQQILQCVKTYESYKSE